MPPKPHLGGNPVAFISDQWNCHLFRRGRNVDRLSIAYAFRPQLRAAYLRVDERCAENLGLAAEGILTPLDATRTGILTSASSTAALASRFTLMRNAPLPEGSAER